MDRKKAASRISAEALASAREAVSARAWEYLKEAERLMEALDRLSNRPIDPKMAEKIERAVSLTMLGYLPVRPETCPFCVQYGRDRSCEGCGYAASHGGRCDEVGSAFYRFIEAYHEFGAAIFQHQRGSGPRVPGMPEGLKNAVVLSCSATRDLLEALEEKDASGLMELKAAYLKRMVGLLPAGLTCGEEVEVLRIEVEEALELYW